MQPHCVFVVKFLELSVFLKKILNLIFLLYYKVCKIVT